MRFRFVEKTKIPQLPKSSGVYVFLAHRSLGEGGKKNRVLYIGKASNLKERVKNHFYPVKYREAVILPKAKLFNRVKQIGYIKTNSEIEALILEANLIKKYQPKYNVVWRDDKNYFYVGITKEDFPRVFITHQPYNNGSRTSIIGSIIGPFVDGASLKQTLKVLRKVFPFRTCKTLPSRPCLWYQLGRCPAPCQIHPVKSSPSEVFAEGEQFNRVKNESQRNAKNLMKILQGKKNQVLKNLKKEMKKASNLEDYEKAAKIRNQIAALEKVLAHANPALSFFDEKREQKYLLERAGQKILQKLLKTKKTISRIEAYDISNIQGQEATGSMVTFISGLPDKNFYRKFKIHPVKSLQGKFNRVKVIEKPNDIAMLKEVLSRRFRHPEWPY
ncbi:MAG: hypothetical protein COX44_02550, partial [Candidatus Portnoybacteria bacterium CG23_combo_of_CG06-09_8_20_14_all_37_13]